MRELNEHVARSEELFQQERQNSERQLRENGELKTELVSMETRCSNQREKVVVFERELSGLTKQLADERKVTEELESLRESFKKRVLLQDKRIRNQTDELEEALEAKENLEAELEGTNFVRCGERRLREQAQELMTTLEKDYGALSVELNMLKFGSGTQQEEIKKLQHSKEYIQTLLPTTKTNDFPSNFDEQPAPSICSKGTPVFDKLLTIANDSGESETSIYYDAEDAVSEDCGPEPIEPFMDTETSIADAKIMTSVDRAFQNDQNSPTSTCSSNSSPVGSKFRPITGNVTHNDGVSKDNDETSNIDEVDWLVQCSCQSSFFSPDNIQHVDFYLPKLIMPCICGKQQVTLGVGDGVMCDLRDILRPWQAEFLASLGINRAPDFVKLFNKGDKISEFDKISNKKQNSLAKSMRRWRRKNKLPSVKTTYCAIALLIWERTCEAVLRSYNTQRASGIDNPKRPAFLEISSLGSVSTLRFGSAHIDSKNGNQEV
jgi:hypothetical protein